MIRYSNYFSEERKNIDISIVKKLLNEQNNKCIICATELTNIKDHKNYHIDHIIPLKSLNKNNILGNNDIENLQLLCNPCHKWKTREFEKNMLVIILENNHSLEISKNFLIDKEFENYIEYAIKQINIHFNDIDNNDITDIDAQIKIYNNFYTNKILTLNSKNILKYIHLDEYFNYMDNQLYLFMNNLNLLEEQYSNNLHNIQEYINIKNCNFYIVQSKKEKKKCKNKNLKKSVSSFTFVPPCVDKELFSITNMKENSKKRKRNDCDCDYEIITKKRKINFF